MHINKLDCIILLMLFISGVIGVLRGFVKEILQLVSLSFAVFCSFFFRKYFTFIFTFIESNFIKEIIAGACIFMLMFILGSIIVYLICQTIKMQGFGKFIDKTLGLNYGFLRGCVILILSVTLLGKNHNITNHDWWQNSILLTKTQQISAMLSKSIPHSWKEKINQIAE